MPVFTNSTPHLGTCLGLRALERLLGEVVAHLGMVLAGGSIPCLVTNLLTSLVDEVWHILDSSLAPFLAMTMHLPSDLAGVDVKNATCCGHVPGGGVSRPHVQDHVHVPERRADVSLPKEHACTLQ